VTILHFCAEADWAAAAEAGEYTADTLATEGFIHCSTVDTAHLPANALARGRTDLVLLEIDETRLTAEVRWEGVPPFPHVYGPIPVAAVIGVGEFRPGSDGTFAPLGA